MKTDTSLLPDGVAESWFHISCGGEVWTSRVCQGRNLITVLDELAPGSYAELLADGDRWHVVDGRHVSISLPCGEDPDIEVALIDAPEFDQLQKDRERLMFLWSLLTDPHGYGLRAIAVPHHDSVRIANDFGLVLADVDMDYDDDDTEDEQGRTWRLAIDQAREKAATLKENPAGFRPRNQ